MRIFCPLAYLSMKNRVSSGDERQFDIFPVWDGWVVSGVAPGVHRRRLQASGQEGQPLPWRQRADLPQKVQGHSWENERAPAADTHGKREQARFQHHTHTSCEERLPRVYFNMKSCLFGTRSRRRRHCSHLSAGARCMHRLNLCTYYMYSSLICFLFLSLCGHSKQV